MPGRILSVLRRRGRGRDGRLSALQLGPAGGPSCPPDRVHVAQRPWGRVHLLRRHADAIADEFERFFVGQGYALEEGTKLTGSYGTGSAKGRAFGGGFVTRKKFDVRIAPTADGHVEAAVISAMSGWSGSLVGVAKERKGRKALNLALEAHFAPYMRA